MFDDFGIFQWLLIALTEPNHRSPVLYQQRAASTGVHPTKPAIFPSKNHSKPALKPNRLSQKKLQTKIFALPSASGTTRW